MNEEKKTSEEWAKTIPNIAILDPDGWDRKNFEYSFRIEKITHKEFQKRLVVSTLDYRSSSESSLDEEM